MLGGAGRYSGVGVPSTPDVVVDRLCEGLAAVLGRQLTPHRVACEDVEVTVRRRRMELFARTSVVVLGPRTRTGVGVEMAAWRVRKALPHVGIAVCSPFTHEEQQEPQDVMVVPKGMAPGRRLPVDWPEYYPPFLPNAVAFAPDGSLWIQRAVSVEDSPLIDIIDDRARLARRLTLPRRSRLVGFGKNGAVYVVRVDDDGLEFLQRYRYQG